MPFDTPAERAAWIAKRQAQERSEAAARDEVARQRNTAIRHWLVEVGRAAEAFEGRWSLYALRRVDPVLYARFQEQRDYFGEMCVTGTEEQIAEHGAGTIRGYAKIIATMEASGAADDAYLLGEDGVSGLRIAIGAQKASAARVIELHGNRVIFMTPDEVAGLVGGLQKFRAAAVVKRIWPGSEIVERYPDEPAKGDSLEDAVAEAEQKWE